ncbi:MAG TPA: Uma2 family endonuclease [Tepidisphaeraceae bacterium]|nr:Uma2 family endonuclease [Tepidisphaeraceae bacterium]
MSTAALLLPPTLPPDDGRITPPVPPDKLATEDAFMAWVRQYPGLWAEWDEGEVVVMAPTGFEHNDVGIWLIRVIAEVVERRKLGVVTFDTWTRLTSPRRQVRAPDIGFVAEARRSIVQRVYVDGPPDAVFEVVSEDSAAHDYRRKYLAYEAAGVREYWIVDPFTRNVELNRLGTDGRYETIPTSADGWLVSEVMTGLRLRPLWLWQAPRPAVAAVLTEMGIA